VPVTWPLPHGFPEYVPVSLVPDCLNVAWMLTTRLVDAAVAVFANDAPGATAAPTNAVVTATAVIVLPTTVITLL
jgi:hypothetical protein